MRAKGIEDGGGCSVAVVIMGAVVAGAIPGKEASCAFKWVANWFAVSVETSLLLFAVSGEGQGGIAVVFLLETNL